MWMREPMHLSTSSADTQKRVRSTEQFLRASQIFYVYLQKERHTPHTTLPHAPLHQPTPHPYTHPHLPPSASPQPLTLPDPNTPTRIPDRTPLPSPQPPTPSRGHPAPPPDARRSRPPLPARRRRSRASRRGPRPPWPRQGPRQPHGYRAAGAGTGWTPRWPPCRSRAWPIAAAAHSGKGKEGKGRAGKAQPPAPPHSAVPSASTDVLPPLSASRPSVPPAR